MSASTTNKTTVDQVLNAGRVEELQLVEKAKRLAAFAAVDQFVGKDCKVRRRGQPVLGVNMNANVFRSSTC